MMMKVIFSSQFKINRASVKKLTLLTKLLTHVFKTEMHHISQKDQRDQCKTTKKGISFRKQDENRFCRGWSCGHFPTPADLIAILVFEKSFLPEILSLYQNLNNNVCDVYYPYIRLEFTR